MKMIYNLNHDLGSSIYPTRCSNCSRIILFSPVITSLFTCSHNIAIFSAREGDWYIAHIHPFSLWIKCTTSRLIHWWLMYFVLLTSLTNRSYYTCPQQGYHQVRVSAFLRKIVVYTYGRHDEHQRLVCMLISSFPYCCAYVGRLHFPGRR